MDLFDSKTGEVLEIREKECPFRTISDLKGYADAEHYELGSSEVDLTGYEPLEVIISRCMRTMKAIGGQTYQVLDVDAIKQEAGYVPSSLDYEASDAKSLDEAFDTQDPTTDPDFDLADASRITSEVEKRLSAAADKQGEVARQVANDDEAVSKALDASNDEADDELRGNVAAGTAAT